MNMKEFSFPGRQTAKGGCCGKPVGCSVVDKGCVHLRHPWKRAHLFGDRTVRCTAWSPVNGQCSLLNGHDGEHGPDPEAALRCPCCGFGVDDERGCRGEWHVVHEAATAVTGEW